MEEISSAKGKLFRKRRVVVLALMAVAEKPVIWVRFTNKMFQNVTGSQIRENILTGFDSFPRQNRSSLLFAFELSGLWLI